MDENEKPWCWWCCHPFSWESLHFPYAFTANTFHTTGHFCSWECMKAYAIDRGKLEQCEYITLMRRRAEGKVSATKRAPSRYCLKRFGGSLPIEDFRLLGSGALSVKIPGEIFQGVVTGTYQVQQQQSQTQSTLKLKRDKPLERTKAKLETSLGIIRKCRGASCVQEGIETGKNTHPVDSSGTL